MATKIQCPFCERVLTLRYDSGPIVSCDGCERQFNAGKLIYQPASLIRRFVGWSLVVIGLGQLLGSIAAILFEVTIETARNAGPREWEDTFFPAMVCFFALLQVSGGLAFVRGRTVVIPSKDDLPAR